MEALMNRRYAELLSLTPRFSGVVGGGVRRRTALAVFGVAWSSAATWKPLKRFRTSRRAQPPRFSEVLMRRLRNISVRATHAFNPLKSGVNLSLARIISCHVTTPFLYAAIRPRMVVRLLRTLAGTVGLAHSPLVMLSRKVAMFVMTPSP